MRGVATAVLMVAAVAVAAVAAGSTPSPPMWGGSLSSAFTVTVNMTNPSPVAYWEFDYYYLSDSDVTASRYEHHAPQYDEMCAGLPYDENYDCTVVFATDGWSYLSFPEPDYCCKCENTFGSVQADWLQANATYVGLSTVNGVECQQWTKQGQYLNHVYCSNDDQQTTVRFNELWGVNRTLKQWDFQLDSYVGSVDKSLLAPPSGCTTLCDNWCAGYRH